MKLRGRAGWPAAQQIELDWRRKVFLFFGGGRGVFGYSRLDSKRKIHQTLIM